MTPSARAGRRGPIGPAGPPATLGVALLAAALLAVSLLGGLAAALAASPSPSPSTKVVLQVGWAEEPDTLSPYLSAARSSRSVWDLVYDTLVDYDAATLEAAPGLATSWDHSADGLVWTFTLRDGVRWQDGRPLTARDVAWTYTFALEHDVPLWREALDGVRGVEAVDERTVRIRCGRPKADLLDLRLPVLPRTSGAMSPRRRSSRGSAGRRRSSGAAPSAPWTGGRASRCGWTRATRTGEGGRSSTRSSCASTATARRWRTTSRPAVSTAPGACRVSGSTTSTTAAASRPPP